MPELPFGWVGSIGLIQEVVENAPDPARFVEIGVWEGRGVVVTVEAIRKSGKAIEMHAVDWFEGGTFDGEENTYLRRLKALDLEGLDQESSFMKALREWEMEDEVVVHKMTSLEAAATFADQSLDYVYIDADHHEHMALADIEAWAPKVRLGGVLAGDDWPEVGPKAAVRRGLQDRGYPVEAYGRCWVVWNWPGWFPNGLTVEKTSATV